MTETEKEEETHNRNNDERLHNYVAHKCNMKCETSNEFVFRFVCMLFFWFFFPMGSTLSPIRVYTFKGPSCSHMCDFVVLCFSCIYFFFSHIFILIVAVSRTSHSNVIMLIMFDSVL